MRFQRAEKIITDSTGSFHRVTIESTGDTFGAVIDVPSRNLKVTVFRDLSGVDMATPGRQPVSFEHVAAERDIEWLRPLVKELQERLPTPPTRAAMVAAAKAAHEANRAYCEGIGDTSQAPWEAAPEWQRESCLAGVAGIVYFGNDPRDSHGAWLLKKHLGGWVYGEVKDPVAKTHPCMVDFDDLPEAQRFKEYLFVAVIRAVFRARGFDVYERQLTVAAGPGPAMSAVIEALDKPAEEFTEAVFEKAMAAVEANPGEFFQPETGLVSAAVIVGQVEPE